MVIYNLDTSVLLDCFEERGNNSINARKLILKIIEEDSTILFSDVHIQELKRLDYTIDQITSFFYCIKTQQYKTRSR